MNRHRSLRDLLAILALTLSLACGGSTVASSASGACGTAGAACCANATCSSGLACTAGTCSDGAASDSGSVSYHDFTDPSFWSSSALLPANAFAGGAFDGRYVYYAPGPCCGSVANGIVARYDTHGAFSDASSWASYPVPGEAAPGGAFGAVFDGRYVYFVPNEGRRVVRYDTRGSFTSAASWSTLGAIALAGWSEGYEGGVFDGRYIYLVPSSSSVPYVIRYDTQASFESASSWTSFDISAASGAARIFGGGVFDGRYVYIVPSGTYFPAPAIRYDTQAPFTSAASWSAFDTTQIGPNEWGFLGAAFDGRYVYFVPSLSPFGGVLRYDTRAPFGSVSSWSTFNSSMLDGASGGTVRLFLSARGRRMCVC